MPSSSRIRAAWALSLSLAIHIGILALGGGPQTAKPAPDAGAALIVSLAGEKKKVATPIPVPAEKPIPAVNNTERASTSEAGRVPKSGWLQPTKPDYFFTLAELDEAPRILHQIDENPAELEAYKEGGRVVIRLWINEEGNVVNHAVVESALPDLFVNNAIKNFLKAKFAAGVKNGQAVKSVVNIVVNYAPVSSGPLTD